MALISNLKRLPAFFLAILLWIACFRRKVVRRNLELMKLRGGQNFRWQLTFSAASDLLALISGDAPQLRIHPRSQHHLEYMRKNPSLLLTAHFHNWELLGSGLRKQGVPLLAAAKALHAPWAEAWLQRLRRNIGVLTVSEGAPRGAFRHVQQGGCFALLWDQHARDAKHSGRFFGLPVRMNPLPVFVLTHHPCPVYFGVLLQGEVRIIALLSRFEGNWENKLIRRYHRVLELLVRKHPELWYGFFHARFKNIALYPGHRPSLNMIPVPA